jgi:hypothetical protein
MGELWKRHPLTVLLGAIALVLLAVIGLETGWGTRIRPPLPADPAPRAAALDAKLLPPVTAIPAEQAYPETGTRPLFTPTRRPAPQATVAGNLAKGQFVLHGVTIVGDQRIAFLKEKSSGKTHRAERGRDVNGISVAEIEPDKVTLKVGEDLEVLPLSVQKTGAGAAVATAPAGPFASPPAAAAPEASPAPPGSARQGARTAPPASPAPAAGTSPRTEPSSTAAGAPGTANPPQRSSPTSGEPARSSSPSTSFTFEDEALARLRARRAQRQQQGSQ